MGCPKLTYHLSPEPRLLCVYNAEKGEDSCVINMNARLYDPVLGRMLSPDPYVQMPDFSQSYNRYAYCINNPLIYIDPSRESLKDLWRKLFGRKNNSNVAQEHKTDDDGGGPLSDHDYDIFIPEVTISGNASKPPSSPPDYSIMNNWDYWYNVNYKSGYYDGGGGGGTGNNDSTSQLPNINASLTGTSITTTIVYGAAKDGIRVAELAREAQTLKVLRPVAGVMKWTGAAGGLVGGGYAIYDLSNATTTGEKIRASLNLTMSGVGFIWPIGTAVSVGWMIVDTAWGEKIFY